MNKSIEVLRDLVEEIEVTGTPKLKSKELNAIKDALLALKKKENFMAWLHKEIEKATNEADRYDAMPKHNTNGEIECSDLCAYGFGQVRDKLKEIKEMIENGKE